MPETRLTARAFLRLDELSDLLNEGHATLTGLAAKALSIARLQGERLIEAKSLCEQMGWEFEEWVEDHCDFSVRTAQRYKRIAERWSEVEQRVRLAGPLNIELAEKFLADTRKKDTGPLPRPKHWPADKPWPRPEIRDQDEGQDDEPEEQEEGPQDVAGNSQEEGPSAPEGHEERPALTLHTSDTADEQPLHETIVPRVVGVRDALAGVLNDLIGQEPSDQLYAVFEEIVQLAERGKAILQAQPEQVP